jgi:hypothetical protein
MADCRLERFRHLAESLLSAGPCLAPACRCSFPAESFGDSARHSCGRQEVVSAQLRSVPRQQRRGNRKETLRRPAAAGSSATDRRNAILENYPRERRTRNAVVQQTARAATLAAGVIYPHAKNNRAVRRRPGEVKPSGTSLRQRLPAASLPLRFAFRRMNGTRRRTTRGRRPEPECGSGPDFSRPVPPPTQPQANRTRW